MGILDYFSKESRQRRKVEGLIKKANNKFTPKDYRQAALYDLIEEGRKGDPGAIQGMISRFSVNAEPSIEDEKEKDWVCDGLIDIGKPALPFISKGLRYAESVNWLQRTLRNIVDEQEYKLELLDVLSDFDTEYERNPDRKLQTIVALADTEDAEVAVSLIPFLEDVNETVRYQTADSLARLRNEIAREPMLKMMCEDESIRIRNHVVDTFAQLGWATQGYKKKIDGILPAGYKHDKTGKIVKLGNAGD